MNVTRQSLEKLMQAFENTQILVVGDLMLDRFVEGKVERISPEAPVPVVRVTKESNHLGGSGNVVLNIRDLGGNALPIGLIGTDRPGEEMKEVLAKNQIDMSGLLSEPDFPSIQKTRIVAHRQQICRVDREMEDPPKAEILERLQARTLKMLSSAHGLIISDYGKGAITPGLIDAINAQPNRCYVSVDPKDKNFSAYHKVDILTPNKSEAERMSDIKIRDLNSLRQAGQKILSTLQANQLLITLGEHGMALFHDGAQLTYIPTEAREVFDVSGAGDTVIATFTLAIASGASAIEAALLANAAAGVVVAKRGTATLNQQELKVALDPALESFAKGRGIPPEGLRFD